MKLKHTNTPRQNAYLQAYTDPLSISFGNSYQSALSAGYSRQTARNLTHLRPQWFTENIGTSVISPVEIVTTLSDIIHDHDEPTVIRLRAIELSARIYGLLSRRAEQQPTTVTLDIDLSSHDRH